MNDRNKATNADLHPAWWLPGPHLQTMWGPVMRMRPRVTFRREVVETPDRDEVVLDHLDGPALAPRFLVLHGLEGSSYSFYVQAVCARLAGLGHRATVLHFRSCARDPADRDTWIPNRTARLYYSGDTGDLGFVARLLREREPDGVLLALGVSVGGNVLLKWLGENPHQHEIVAAATISVPFDLAAGARNLQRGLGPFYTSRFLRTLKAKAENLAIRFPEVRRSLDLERTMRARDFRTFDDAATAPLHGFAGAADYYERSSSIRYVGRIETPTLCISAEDDPFLPRAVLSEFRRVASPAIELKVTRKGGHCGFVAGSPRHPTSWAEELVVHWLLAQAA